jgi:serine O-acetyltransferase
MTFGMLLKLVSADLFRYGGAHGWLGFARTLIWEAGFRYTWVVRVGGFLRSQKWSRWGVYHLFKFWRHGLSLKLGIYLDFGTEIAGGLYIPHPYGIIVNRRSQIGENCNIAQHVTIGLKSRDPNKGCPVLGNRVYVGPGAVIIGGINVGDDVAIGANCVVVKDVPSRAVVVGVPGRVVSMRSSEGYINDCEV